MKNCSLSPLCLGLGVRVLVFLLSVPVQAWQDQMYLVINIRINNDIMLPVYPVPLPLVSEHVLPGST